MKLVCRIAAAGLAAGVLLFAVLETIVLMGCRDDADRDAPVVIVLGAKVWPGGPSPAMVRRLEKALEYHRSHPDALLIVSGGQGADEPESEAKAMRDYLIDNGVSEEQIVLEDRSTSTAENLRFSKEKMQALGYDPETTPVVIVSNSFHLARVRMLAKRYGLDADTLGAPMPDRNSALYSYTREAPALLNSFLFD